MIDDPLDFLSGLFNPVHINPERRAIFLFQTSISPLTRDSFLQNTKIITFNFTHNSLELVYSANQAKITTER
jgi:hypothetical protein